MARVWFDTHCHLQDGRFGAGRKAVIRRAQEAGVSRLVCCGASEADWDDVLLLAEEHDCIVPMLGLHPWYVRDASSLWLERLEEHVRSGRVGIGECGLDFAIEDVDRVLQEEVFLSQLRLARDLDLPVSIHCRKAWERLLVLCGEVGLSRAGGAVHAYSGSPETARDLQKLGLHISFSCSLANPANQHSPKSLVAVALDRLLFETDAPDIAPRWMPGFEEGMLNEPANISLVAKAAARILSMDIEILARKVYENSWDVFGGLCRDKNDLAMRNSDEQ